MGGLGGLGGLGGVEGGVRGEGECGGERSSWKGEGLEERNDDGRETVMGRLFFLKVVVGERAVLSCEALLGFGV